MKKEYNIGDLVLFYYNKNSVYEGEIIKKKYSPLRYDIKRTDGKTCHDVVQVIPLDITNEKKWEEIQREEIRLKEKRKKFLKQVEN